MAQLAGEPRLVDPELAQARVELAAPVGLVQRDLDRHVAVAVVVARAVDGAHAALAERFLQVEARSERPRFTQQLLDVQLRNTSTIPTPVPPATPLTTAV